MKLKFRAWFPNSKRMIHFSGASMCSEYDQLCFSIDDSDCTEEYQHLAGTSYIPNGEFNLELSMDESKTWIKISEVV